MGTEKKYWESKEETLSSEIISIINEYLLSLKLSNKAEATIIKYRRILDQFFKECNTSVETLTSDTVLKWLNNFSQGKKAKTIDLYLSALSSFFQFCLEEEHMEKMVIKRRWRPKIPQSLPKYLTETEYAMVKVSAEALPVRDRALILFLFSSGCRCSEVSGLSLTDIQLDKRTAEVKGKGKKIRKVHFSEECALIMQEYLNTRIDDEQALFITRFGKRMLPGAIYQVTRKLGERAGMKQSLHPHSCRHTFATNMLARGADLEFIADEMGHSDLNTTRIYARIPTEEMMLTYQNIMG